MITFYRTKDCEGCQWIQDTLHDMVIVHEVVVVEQGADSWKELPEGTRPPVLVDDGKIIEGNHAIIKHLDKLEKFKGLWEKFQSDACYCDDEGNIE